MVVGFNSNDYGITRKEFREFKKEMKKLDRENDAIKLTNKDYKEIKAHIKNGDLGAYMENVGEEMRAAMGLKLSNKVDIDKEIAASVRIAHATHLGQTPDGKDVDMEKVTKYIQAANYQRIAANQEEFNGVHKNLEVDNSRAMAERFFGSDLNSALLSEFENLA